MAETSDAHLSPSAQKATKSPIASAKAHLPFTVKIVRTPTQLSQAIAIRTEAYKRHLPKIAELMDNPEELDLNPDSIIFIAEAKLDKTPLGTIRIQTNFSTPLALEDSISLPKYISGRPSAGVSRLAIIAGSRGRLVKLALFKALHRYCLAKQVEWVLIGARHPLDQSYIKLGFSDLYEDALPRPLRSAGGVPHRILALEVFKAERLWHELSHPLYIFMGEKFHPDIEIFSSVANSRIQPRQSNSGSTPPVFNLDLPII